MAENAGQHVGDNGVERPGNAHGIPEETAKPSKPGDPARLALLQWFILRSDQLRMSYSARAIMILGAASILVGLAGFVLNRLLELPVTVEWLAALVLTLAAMVMMGVSFYQGVRTALPLWKDSWATREKAGPRLFFGPGQTIDALPTVEEFGREFDGVSVDKLSEYARNELWAVTLHQKIRHRRLRRSVEWLFYGAVTLAAAFGVLLATYALDKLSA